MRLPLDEWRDSFDLETICDCPRNLFIKSYFRARMAELGLIGVAKRSMGKSTVIERITYNAIYKYIQTL